MLEHRAQEEHEAGSWRGPEKKQTVMLEKAKADIASRERESNGSCTGRYCKTRSS